MVFAIRLGSRGSLRKIRRIRAFGPPKNTLGPVSASQNIVKHVSFVSHEAEKCSLLQCFSTRKVPFFRFSFGKCTCFTCFLKLSSAVAKMTYFTHIWSLSRKMRFLAKRHLSRNIVFYGFSTFATFWGPHFLAFCRTVDKSKQNHLTKWASE